MTLDWLGEQLDLAQRDALDADHLFATGIAPGSPSRFGWPGRMLRTAVLRLLRPYAHFEARANRQHLQSTIRILKSLRRVEAEAEAARAARAQTDGTALSLPGAP